MITFVTSVFNPPTKANLSALFSWNLARIPTVVVTKGIVQEQLPFPNIQVISDVRTEEDMGFSGDSPHLGDMLRRGIEVAKTPLVGLINADIIINRGFQDRLREITQRRGQEIFLSSVRRDVKYPGVIDSSEEYTRFFQLPAQNHQDKSADLFVSSKQILAEMIKHMPDFILGRTVWDNWIHIYFKKSGIPCYDSSKLLVCHHIIHNYDHLKAPLGKHPSVNHNMSLVNKPEFVAVRTWPQP